MLFTSLTFFEFFLAVYVLYLLVNWRWQNRLLLVASYIFYASWDWRFVPLLLGATWVSYYSGVKMEAASTPVQRLRFLKLTLYTELGLLALFKYFNFFIDNVIRALHAMGVSADPAIIRIILPLGISYYTFQAISYSVDVYRNKTPATHNFAEFALFKSFFPIIFGGPIERANNLLKQVQAPRTISWTYLEQGVFLILWGLTKKIYISNHIAPMVDHLFGEYKTINGLETWLAAYGFALQLYCDFSGYTDIARGLARVMGFDLALNFNLPYFAKNPIEFWRTWHMSLSSWFNDYFYEPLFFRVKNIYISLFFTFFLIALWHGASWNFIVLGIYNGAVICIYVFLRPYIKRALSFQSPEAKKAVSFLGAFFMFHVTCFGFLFFRSQSLVQIGGLLTNLFSGSYAMTEYVSSHFGPALFFLAPLIVMQFFQLKTKDLYAFLALRPKVRFAWSLAMAQLALLVYLFSTGIGSTGQFIYFQF